MTRLARQLTTSSVCFKTQPETILEGGSAQTSQCSDGDTVRTMPEAGLNCSSTIPEDNVDVAQTSHLSHRDSRRTADINTPGDVQTTGTHGPGQNGSAASEATSKKHNELVKRYSLRILLSTGCMSSSLAEPISCLRVSTPLRLGLRRGRCHRA